MVQPGKQSARRPAASIRKFLWLNAQHIKAADNARLAELITPRLTAAGISTAQGPALAKVVALVKGARAGAERAGARVIILSNSRASRSKPSWTSTSPGHPASAWRAARQTGCAAEWNTEAIHGLFKPFCAEEGIKMGQLGMLLRVLVCGITQTPSVDAVLALIGREQVLARPAG